MNLKANSSEMDGSRVLQEDLMNLKANSNSSEMDDSKVLQGDLMNLKANSSEMDGSRVLQGDSMRVFTEGVSLLMDNLWLRHVFVEENCGSNPSLVLRYLADVILFWFTQTIKPVSLVYIEWILKYEMFFLPVTNYDDGITEE
ncbi:hypothetical protein A2U01_0019413, partial [Trifolium medium]|nr:hypothetical protein [Trifolium medium]